MKLPLDDPPRPWDRQPGEPSFAFHAFTHFRDHGPGRTLYKAHVTHVTICQQQPYTRVRLRAPSRWGDMSIKWGWVERAERWDREQDRLAQEKISKDQVDARVRHARLAQATLQALSVPARATLESLQSPDTMAKLVAQAQASPRAFLKLVELVSWASKSVPGVVGVERLALGMTTDKVQVEAVDRRGMEIPNDPEARDLAMALLARLADKQDDFNDLP